MEFDEPPKGSMSYEEGLSEIDAFFLSPDPKPDEFLPTSSEQATQDYDPEQEQLSLALNDDDPFANLLKDIEGLPDDALFGPALHPSTYFGHSFPPNPCSPTPPDALESDRRFLPSNALPPPTVVQAPTIATPVNRDLCAKSLNSSGNRSQLYEEMREEEYETTSPIQTSPPKIKLALPAHNTPAHTPSRLAPRSDDEIFALRSHPIASPKHASASDALERGRVASSPPSDSQSRAKKAKGLAPSPMHAMKSEQDPTQEATAAEGTGTTKRASRKAVGDHELKDTIGDVSYYNMGKSRPSPRKTRKQQKTEQESRPNASAAAKRRHSTPWQRGEESGA